MLPVSHGNLPSCSCSISPRTAVNQIACIHTASTANAPRTHPLAFARAQSSCLQPFRFVCQRPQRDRRRIVTSAASQVEIAGDSQDQVPPGCARYSVQLSKPLGLVLEEDKSGNIYVAEVVSGGNAEKSGVISKGDQLIATSGMTYTSVQYYNDNAVRGGEKVVRLNVRGEDFDTVMAAIGSHQAHIKVRLDFQRC